MKIILIQNQVNEQDEKQKQSYAHVQMMWSTVWLVTQLFVQYKTNPWFQEDHHWSNKFLIVDSYSTFMGIGSAAMHIQNLNERTISSLL